METMTSHNLKPFEFRGTSQLDSGRVLLFNSDQLEQEQAIATQAQKDQKEKDFKSLYEHIKA